MKRKLKIPVFAINTDLVERTPDINGAVLNDFIYNFWDRLSKIWISKLKDK